MYEFRYKTYKDFKFDLLDLKPYCNKKIFRKVLWVQLNFNSVKLAILNEPYK